MLLQPHRWRNSQHVSSYKCHTPSTHQHFLKQLIVQFLFMYLMLIVFKRLFCDFSILHEMNNIFKYEIKYFAIQIRQMSDTISFIAFRLFYFYYNNMFMNIQSVAYYMWLTTHELWVTGVYGTRKNELTTGFMVQRKIHRTYFIHYHFVTDKVLTWTVNFVACEADSGCVCINKTKFYSCDGTLLASMIQRWQDILRKHFDIGCVQYYLVEHGREKLAWLPSVGTRSGPHVFVSMCPIERWEVHVVAAEWEKWFRLKYSWIVFCCGRLT